MNFNLLKAWAMVACLMLMTSAITAQAIINILASAEHPSCHSSDGPPTGTITLSLSGGTPPYAVLWSGPNIVDASSRDQFNLGEGSYTVVVTDSDQNSQTETYTLTEPEFIDIHETLSNPSCNIANGVLDGEIDIVVAGGTPPYIGISFEWTGPGAIAYSQNQYGLGEGDFTLIVTDAAGCTYSETYELREPEGMAIEERMTQPSCSSYNGDRDGGIDIVVAGGTPPYSFEWTGPGVIAHSQNQHDLGEGTYTVDVTDATGLCTYTETYEMTEPEEIDIRVTLVNPSCHPENGALDGDIDLVAVSGATAPYSYRWAGPGVFSGVQDQTGLGAGTYHLTVTDANGCSYMTMYELNEPEPIEVIANVGDPSCSLDGYIDLFISGGSGFYTFDWTGPGIDPTAEDHTGLGSGVYNLTITDENACTHEVRYELSGSDYFSLRNTTVQDPACELTLGAIDLVVSGGIEPFTYEWIGPDVEPTSGDQDNLGAGLYSVIVTDANGCQIEGEFELSGSLDINASLQSTSCLTGNVSVDIGTGTMPITVRWEDGYEGQQRTDLASGTYQVTVEDGEGCLDKTTLDIAWESTIELTAERTSSTQSTVDYLLGVSGSTGPYAISWSSPTGGQLDHIDDALGTDSGVIEISGMQKSHNYLFIVSDSLGCQSELTLQNLDEERLAAPTAQLNQFLRYQMTTVEDSEEDDASDIRQSLHLSSSTDDPEPSALVLPNPFVDALYLHMDKPGAHALMDLQGRVVLRGHHEAGVHMIDTQALMPGLYYLSLVHLGEALTLPVIRN